MMTMRSTQINDYLETLCAIDSREVFQMLENIVKIAQIHKRENNKDKSFILIIKFKL